MGWKNLPVTTKPPKQPFERYYTTTRRVSPVGGTALSALFAGKGGWDIGKLLDEKYGLSENIAELLSPDIPM